MTALALTEVVLAILFISETAVDTSFLDMVKDPVAVPLILIVKVWSVVWVVYKCALVRALAVTPVLPARALILVAVVFADQSS